MELKELRSLDLKTLDEKMLNETKEQILLLSDDEKQSYLLYALDNFLDEDETQNTEIITNFFISEEFKDIFEKINSSQVIDND